MTHTFLLALLLILTSCLKSEDVIELRTSAFYQITPGDIIVTNTTSRSVVQLDKNGNFKNKLFTADLGQALHGVAWLDETKEVIITVSAPNRIIGISAFDLSVRTINISTTTLAGTIRGMAVNAESEILFTTTTTNQIRKMSSSGVYITGDGFPLATGMTNIHQLSALSDGGFLACSYGGNNARTYSDLGVQVANRTSGIAGTVQGYGCTELADGNIAVAWTGTTDSVVIYDSTLTDALFTYSNTAILGNPRMLAQAENGNILVLDFTNSWIVEIDQEGEFVRTFANGQLSGPIGLIVVPAY